MVELYAADIRQIEPRAQELLALLDEDRQARVRAQGGSRSALLSLAAGLLLNDVFGVRAQHARYERGSRGKPVLPDQTPFNLTHSGHYAVLARSPRAVGVDLEQVRPIDWEKIGARFFHPLEQAHLAAAADPASEFFRVWTLKESYLKAEGVGFSVSPASFAILPEGGQTARFVGETAYRFFCVDAFEGYRLSVCTLEDDPPNPVIVRSF